MAGPQTIQRFPRGLLDALQMKGTGDAPGALAAELTATFDATQLYLLDRLTSVRVATSAMSNGFSASTIVVPATELWLLVAVSGIVNAGVGMTGTTTIAVRRASLLVPATALGEGLTFAASTVPLLSTSQARGLILTPGDALGTYSWNLAGAPTMDILADYYRLTF